MKRHRLRAPDADGALLAEPPLSQAGARLVENVGRLERWDAEFQGRRAGRLRAMVRQQVLAQARHYHAQFGLESPPEIGPGAPLVVAGHQPELFHAGVWVKNFALAGLAREHQAAGLNLVVDNDIPKSSSIRVPHLSQRGLHTVAVEFDDGMGEVPYEDLKVNNEERFASFPDRVHQVLGGLVADPVLDEFWPLVERFRRQTDRTGARFALARHAVETNWGVRNWEVPLSAVCETEGFLWFASHLLAQLARFQELHNAALARYRAAHGIRSRHHPVPALGREGEWLEAPFWVWRAGQPRRRPLLVRQLASTMELRIAGEDAPFVELPLAPDREACCAVERLLFLPAQQIRLRTRALTTTLFARLLLGDVFLHGIGGAKYDELNDEICRSFFGFEPPAYLTLSMTLWLGLPDDPADAERLHSVERGLRDLTFKPEHHLTDSSDTDLLAWVEAKKRAIGAPTDTHAERVVRFQEIRKCNQALQGAVEAARSELQVQRLRLGEGLRRNAVAHSREYAFVLHSRARLREALARVVPEAFRG
ncbi:MAG TPA: hypothetical protein VGZ22_05235 [Isosphaeraceae bacterium]|nr:hypothetical protein [Isosphaeraceae bacterium]